MSMNLKAITSDYYGDNIRWFIGIAVNNKDPLKLGRVQVRIRGIHSNSVQDIPNCDLPWAQVTIPGTEPGISGMGKAPKIENGAQVFGIFMDGKSSQIPLVLGSMPHLEKNTRDEAKTSNYNNRILNNIDKSLQNKFSTNAAVPRAAPGSKEIAGESTGEKIFNFFLSNGYNSDQACAFVGNLSYESGLNVLGNGIGDWKGKRYRDMILYCNENNLPIELEGQLKFIIQELGTTFTAANGSILAARNLKEAVKAVQEKYFRKDEGYDARYSFARDVVERYLT